MSLVCLTTQHGFRGQEVMITVTQFSYSEKNDELACQIEVIGHFSICLISIMFLSERCSLTFSGKNRQIHAVNKPKTNAVYNLEYYIELKSD